MKKKSENPLKLHYIQSEKQVILEWKNVSVWTRPKWDWCSVFRQPTSSKHLLRGVSGISEPGVVTAIMGCSGAGKSTLLNVLAGHKLSSNFEMEGQVTLNKIPIADIDSLSKVVGYIQQHDVLPEVLTVEEYLTFTAQLILSQSISDDEKNQRVQHVMNQLSLGKCADVLIGGERTEERISGGERKRVSIALKLLRDPQILILDEPTSGLDSYIANNLMKMLGDLASQRYTVLCTIHQPSSEVFTSFNSVILLADGRCAYSGPASQAVDYFTNLGYPCPPNFNPADYFIKLITVRPGLEHETQRIVEFLCDCYDISRNDVAGTFEREQPNTKKIKHTPKRFELESSTMTQCHHLFVREFKGLIRLPKRILSQTFSAMITTIFLAGLYYNPHMRFDQSVVKNLSAATFLYVAHFSLLNAMALLQTVTRQMPLVSRETRDGLYGPVSFYVSMLSKEIVINIFLVVVLEFFGTYYLIGLKREPTVILYTLLILVTCIICVNTLCFLIAVLFEDTIKALYACVPVAVLFNLLGGFFINPRSAPAYVMPVFVIDWIPWAYEIISVLQWRNVTGIECELKTTVSCVSTGEQVLKRQGFDEKHLGGNAALLVTHVLIYTVLALGYFVVKIRKRRST